MVKTAQREIDSWVTSLNIPIKSAKPSRDIIVRLAFS
jgi:hypothetical protein